MSCRSCFLFLLSLRVKGFSVFFYLLYGVLGRLKCLKSCLRKSWKCCPFVPLYRILPQTSDWVLVLSLTKLSCHMFPPFLESKLYFFYLFLFVPFLFFCLTYMMWNWKNIRSGPLLGISIVGCYLGHFKQYFILEFLI